VLGYLSNCGDLKSNECILLLILSHIFLLLVGGISLRSKMMKNTIRARLNFNFGLRLGGLRQLLLKFRIRSLKNTKKLFLEKGGCIGD